MKWIVKAGIMATSAAMPEGERFYQWGQRRFGRLTPDPSSRLASAVRLSEWIASSDGPPLTECTLMEVGTGHVPLVPTYLWLLGAHSVWTLDLHHRLNEEATRATLQGIVSGWNSGLGAALERASHDQHLERRFAVLRELADSPSDFMDAAKIRYRAPADAARTTFPDGSVDVAFSVSVLEHIPSDAILAILAEERRILGKTGRSIHFVDMTDHFQHQDPNITTINFLRFRPWQWRLIGGNEYAYCNRLRASELRQLFARAGFEEERVEIDVNVVARAAMELGRLRVAPEFANFSLDDLAAGSLGLLVRPT